MCDVIAHCRPPHSGWTARIADAPRAADRVQHLRPLVVGKGREVNLCGERAGIGRGHSGYGHSRPGSLAPVTPAEMSPVAVLPPRPPR